MSKVGSIIVTVVLSVLLIIAVFVGFRLAFDSPTESEAYDLAESLDTAPIDVLTPEEGDYVEIVVDTGKGDVAKIYNYNFRVSGELVVVPGSTDGYFDYLCHTDGSKKTVTYTQGVLTDSVMDNMAEYFKGNTADLVQNLPVTTVPENLTFYMQETMQGNIPIIYNEGDAKYYMLVPMSTMLVVIESEEMLYMTEDAETVIFGDPSEDPMTYHTYSMYEITAIENTRNQLSGGTLVGTTDTLPTDVSGVASTYTSEADNDTRKQMLSYAGLDWRKDGTSPNTSSKLDVTSAVSKASEWVLTSSSPYSFTDNAIKLHSLRATRNTESFAVEGKCSNQLSLERPYVVLIKFLNSDDELLGVGVVDKRSEPIEANGVSEWDYLLNTDSGIDLQEIYALQFEVY